MKRLYQLVTKRSVAQIHTQGALACVAAAAVLVAAALPALSQRADRLALHIAVEAADLRLQRTRAQIDGSRREIGTINTQLEAAARVHVSAAPLDRRLLDVSSIANDVGLLVESVEPGAVTKAADGTAVTGVAVSGRGTYPSIVAYMTRMREAAPDLTIETAGISTSVDGTCVFRLGLNWWSPPVNVVRQIAAAETGEHP